MRVLCIDASTGTYTGCTPKFKEGDILNAAQSPVHHDCYHIEGHKECFCNNCGGSIKSWIKSRFIPLSEIDELELVNVKQLTNA